MASSAEASARTLTAAVAAAAAQLGLRHDQVDVEVLEEAVPSTFGTIGRPARVRVTVRGASSNGAVSPDGDLVQAQAGRQATARTVDQPSAPDVRSTGRRPAPSRERSPIVLDPEAIAADTELAGDFVEGFLDVLDLDGDIDTWVDANGGHVDIDGEGLDVLIGTDGETLAALQEITRLAVLRQAQRRVRITVDVSGHRARQQEELAAASKATAERVVETGQPERLRPMTPFERKVVHDAVALVEGATTESVGEEPDRFVIVRPAVS